MNAKSIGYWVVTGLFCFALAGSGVMDFLKPPEMLEGMQHLGYPPYILTILGFWKLLGVFGILFPGFPRVKEWAHAGFFFHLTGAIASHLFVGDGIGGTAVLLVLLLLNIGSYLLRPASRVLGTMPWETAKTV